MQGAIIVDNVVTMSPPEGSVFDQFSAGIWIGGFAQGNVVQDNRIRGRSGAALAADNFRSGTPASNAFVLNRLDHFEASVADIFVDDGVLNTLIVGQAQSTITAWARLSYGYPTMQAAMKKETSTETT